MQASSPTMDEAGSFVSVGDVKADLILVSGIPHELALGALVDGPANEPPSSLIRCYGVEPLSAAAAGLWVRAAVGIAAFDRRPPRACPWAGRVHCGATACSLGRDTCDICSFVSSQRPPAPFP